MEGEKYTMHLIINTHWDREYRWSFPETQLRLVEAVDLLLEVMEKDPRFYSFHTDSQVSMLDDYLALRPEKREVVERLVKEGRLQTGPWYTLPAQFLVSGEALTRNLLTGHRIARSLGGVMKVGYNIFSWGQISQLPQLYAQFGMDTILFYRGIDQSALDSLEFHWEAPDGTRALGITFGAFHRLNFWVYVYKPYIFGIRPGTNPEGFRRTGEDGMMTHLSDPYSDDINHHILDQPSHRNLRGALEGLEELLKSVTDKSSTRHLLFLQGFDQELPDPVVPDLVDELNRETGHGTIVIDTLPEYVNAVREELEEKKLMDKLPRLTGEMLSVEKQGDPFGPLYPGVFSARMPVKLKNHDCQVRLERWAEPASAWAYMTGEEYPLQPLRAAWKELLQNQQHDGIGGCHVDRVTTAMMERYANVRDTAETLTRQALHTLVKKIDFSGLTEKDTGLVVFNPHPYTVDLVVEAVVDVPVEHDPGVAGKYSRESSLEITTAAGRQVPVQMLLQEWETVYAYLTYGSHTSFDARRNRVVFEAKELPPLGFRKYFATPVAGREEPQELIGKEPGTMENEHLKVTVHADGTLTLEDKATGTLYENLHYFEDEGDQGGPLVFIPPKGEGPYTTKGLPAQVVRVQNGPLMARYRIEREWLLPAALASEIKIHVPHGMQWIDHGTLQRSEEKTALKIVTEVTLRKGSRHLEFTTTVDNSVKDHRLRVVFPTRLPADHVWADIPYDVVRREIKIPESKGWYEKPLRTWPSATFVDVSDGQKGLAVLHYGIPEYEVSDDEQRAVHLTLLRAFRTAGNPSETHLQQPLAQCPGRHTFRYALYPHPGDWKQGAVEKEAALFNVPVRVAQCSNHRGEIMQEMLSFLKIPAGLILSAVKMAEEEQALVVRFYNPAEETVTGELFSHAEIGKAVLVTLEEMPQEELTLFGGDHRVKITVEPKRIMSVMLFLKNTG